MMGTVVVLDDYRQTKARVHKENVRRTSEMTVQSLREAMRNLDERQDRKAMSYGKR